MVQVNDPCGLFILKKAGVGWWVGLGYRGYFIYSNGQIFVLTYKPEFLFDDQMELG